MRDAEREQGAERRARKIGDWIGAIEGGLPTAGLEGGKLTGLQVRFPTEEEPSTLLIIKASSEAGKHIAFVGAYNLGDALLAWLARAKGDRVRWREDVPWGQRG